MLYGDHAKTRRFSFVVFFARSLIHEPHTPYVQTAMFSLRWSRTCQDCLTKFGLILLRDDPRAMNWELLARTQFFSVFSALIVKIRSTIDFNAKNLNLTLYW